MSVDTTPSLADGLVLSGSYRIVRFIGRGGMGEVYEAAHARLSGRYAVKLLLKEIGAIEEAIRRFKQEAEITSRLRHPNIVQVVDFAQMDDGAAFMVMEFLEGHDLAEELRQKGTLPIARVLDITHQVANGLAAAHAEGVVHRDLKPANIFLTPLRGSNRELAKIVDFGISKVRAASTGLTQTQTIIGTPQYMAPEQARGLTKTVDARTDQFGFAVIVYEMLAGRPAFEGEGVASVLYQVVHEPAPSLASLGRRLPPAVDAVLARAMAKNPADRFENVEAFADALSAAAAPGAGDAEAALRATEYQMTPPPIVRAGGASGASDGARPATQKAIASTTTFRNASGQMSSVGDDEFRLTQRLTDRKKKFLVAGVASGVALLGIVAVLALRGDGTAPGNTPVAGAAPPPAAVAPVAPLPGKDAPPERISVDIGEVPPGLTVTVDGLAAKLPLSLPADAAKHKVIFSAPGFLPEERHLGGKRDLSVELTLRPLPAPRPERARPGPAAKPKVKPRPSSVVTDL